MYVRKTTAEPKRLFDMSNSSQGAWAIEIATVKIHVEGERPISWRGDSEAELRSLPAYHHAIVRFRSSLLNKRALQKMKGSEAIQLTVMAS